MKLEGDTICFKTGTEWFLDEKHGCKPFTVRLVTEREWDDITTWWTDYKDCVCQIQISATFSGDNFTRRVMRIGKIGELVGSGLIFVSWKHEEGEG
jgi:hypothetical protein